MRPKNQYLPKARSYCLTLNVVEFPPAGHANVAMRIMFPPTCSSPASIASRALARLPNRPLATKALSARVLGVGSLRSKSRGFWPVLSSVFKPWVPERLSETNDQPGAAASRLSRQLRPRHGEARKAVAGSAKIVGLFQTSGQGAAPCLP